MNKRRINQRTVERCLLTEIAPYETPIPFSNWGSYNYCRTLKKNQLPPFLLKLFTNEREFSIPYKYRINKDGLSHRTLSLTHPKHAEEIVEFYEHYEVMILRTCKRSPFSLRAPHHVAKFYTIGKGEVPEEVGVEDITVETAYASSYFSYSRYSHLHKFFDSDEFTELEKRYSQLLHVDIARFFPSLYTHSISWAVRGKKRTKDSLHASRRRQTFDAVFDGLLQDMNYRETHGIPIGPELCRIFAEIILQRVDAIVVDKLTDLKIALGPDYWCQRYIDDYYVFFNGENTRTVFMRVLEEELEKYRLHINASKVEQVTRPFITPLSIRKLELSEFLTTFSRRLSNIRSGDSHKAINNIRSLTKDTSVPFSSVSTFLLSAIERQIRGLSIPDPQRCFDALYVLLEMAFHCFRMDIRAHPSFKIASIILDVTKKQRGLARYDQQKIMDKIAFEMRNAVDSALAQGSAIECMNILIVLAEFVDTHPLPPSVIANAITRLRELHNDEYSTSQRLSYFEIVSLLYYIGNRTQYSEEKLHILEEAKSIITDYDPREYAETAYLLLDLISCPHLDRDSKNDLISAAMRHGVFRLTTTDIGHFRNYVSSHSWYFHWNADNDLRMLLKKKELQLSY